MRWYLSFKLSYRDLVSMMNERGMALSHTTILRWVQHYTPEFQKRWTRFARPVGGSWLIGRNVRSCEGPLSGKIDLTMGGASVPMDCRPDGMVVVSEKDAPTPTAKYRRGVDCTEIVRDRAVVSAMPEVKVTHPLAKVTHEAAIGRVDSRQLETLMARGLDPDSAVDLIIRGLSVGW